MVGSVLSPVLRPVLSKIACGRGEIHGGILALRVDSGKPEIRLLPDIYRMSAGAGHMPMEKSRRRAV